MLCSNFMISGFGHGLLQTLGEKGFPLKVTILVLPFATLYPVSFKHMNRVLENSLKDIVYDFSLN